MANFAWRSVRARCPYYLRSRERTITCAGFGDGQEIRVRYRSEAACSEAFGCACAMHYTMCQIYRMHEKAEQ